MIQFQEWKYLFLNFSALTVEVHAKYEMIWNKKIQIIFLVCILSSEATGKVIISFRNNYFSILDS